MALLLPLTSEHGAAARAIRDGYLSTYFSDRAQWPVAVYDTQGRAERTVAAYQTAAIEGATLVVGPLLKSGLNAILQQSKSGVQTLALNYNDSASSLGIYTFGLAPEDEADEAARSAFSQGLRRAILMTSSDDWGNRIGSSFRKTFESLGGRIVDAGSYDPEAYDFSENIKKLLKVERRASRHHSRRIRRRQDIDVIFVSARAEASRMLIPQLHFYGASDLPIYATAEVNDGSIHGHYRNRLRFCAMPLIVDIMGAAASLRLALLEAFPEASTEQLRLMALGHDAYRLAEFLELHGQIPSRPVHAASGTLNVDENRAIRRHLTCVQIAHGSIRSIVNGATAARH